MKIGLIGLGTVGGTLQRWFEENTKHELALHDPPKGLFQSLEGCEAIFISVPVPSDHGGQDLTILKKAVTLAKKHTNNVFVRSTVLPGTNDALGTIAMPEFLTERRAYEDFCKLPILVGRKRISDKDDMDIQRRIRERGFYVNIFPNMNLAMMSNTEAELAKFTHNCFGAMKVTYFNIIYDLCKKIGANFEYVKQAASLTGFIEMEHHTQVPGPDGLKGYGGKCFPENIKAFKSYLVSPTVGMIEAALFFQNIHSLNLVHRHSPNKDIVGSAEL